MADFVAVIRRAVDGLSDNTPEMRVKVYEKARGAVLRQLESMKPRPPEEMLRRQLDKLEAAILEVEAEHAEALPAEQEPEIVVPEEVGPAPVPPEPEPEPELAAEPAPDAAEAAPVYEEPAAAPAVAEEIAPRPAEEPVHPSPVAIPTQTGPSPALFGDESWAGEESSEPALVEPVYDAPHHAEPEVQEPAYAHEVPQHPLPVEDHGEAFEPEPASAEPVWQPEEEPEAIDDFVVPEPTEHYARAGVVPAETHSAALQDWPEQGVGATATASVIEPEWTAEASYDAPASEPIADTAPELLTAYEEAGVPVDPLAWQPEQEPVDILPVPSEFVEVGSVQGELAAAQQDSFDEPVLHADVAYHPEPAASTYYQPQPLQPETSQPPLTQEAEQEDWDSATYNDLAAPVDDRYAPAAARADERRTDDDEWDEFEEFSNYDKSSNNQADDLLDEDFVSPPPEKPARSYRIQPKRRIDLTSLGFGLLGLALVAGSGYGAWTFRDTLSGLVTGLVSAPPSETKPAASTTPAKPADTSKDGAANGTAPAATDTGAAAGKSATTAADSADQDVQKFTQRLKADGSESDEGAASGAGGGEGKSLAQQTVASTEPASTNVQTAPSNSVTTTPAAIPVGVSQKMFLYEERVGQASPVAIEGAVVWSLKHDKTENGKEEAVVQAQVTAPERGLSALISFKRNLDPSLPASHLVELVFSLPKDFEGGAIESVQRVALKRTEQDRGDPLVAVPAKITDDFHMIALNDYADARDFNLKLLQSRDWIDIPVTYRNGRRALITMEKGSTGTEAFNQAIAEWRAADPTASAVPANPAPGPTPAPAPAQAAPADQAPAPNPAQAPAAAAPANPQ